MDQLHKVAEFLYEFEKINGADFDRLMKGDFSVFDEYRAKKEQETNQASAGTKPELPLPSLCPSHSRKMTSKRLPLKQTTNKRPKGYRTDCPVSFFAKKEERLY